MAKTFLRRFRDDECGAVTVDWVVLTAGLIAFGIAVTTTIVAGANDMSTGAGARLADATVPDVHW